MNEKELERLVGTCLTMDLEDAEKALIKGREVRISLMGETPGEKLAYIAATKWIVEKIRLDDCDFRTAFEAYQEVIKGQ